MSETWLQRLNWLSARFSHLGMAQDMGEMTLTEQWAIYRFAD